MNLTMEKIESLSNEQLNEYLKNSGLVGAVKTEEDREIALDILRQIKEQV